MRQQTLASQAIFEKHGRKSKRELFLDQMEQVVPWSELLSLVEPHYPKAGNGRQPVGLAIMLRTYFLQQWFNLSEPGMEEAFYKSPVLRRFAGVDLEWPFRILKRIFGFIKVRYRSLKKNWPARSFVPARLLV